jgi:predicted lipoprotein with Yx(FWY)xxD motif
MRPTPRLMALASLAIGIAVFASACSSAAATPTLAPTDTPAPMDTPTAAAPTPTAAVAGDSSSPAASQAAAGLTLGSGTGLGGYLTGDSGMTLYIYTKDSPDTTVCYGACATNWPPLTVPAGTKITGPSGATKAFATITRTDGTLQVTYNHWPLYYYAGDSAAGDTTGQNIGGVWFVAPLSGSH